MGPDDGEGHGMRKARVFGQVLGVQGMGIEDVTVQVDPDGDEEVLVVSVRPDAPASGRTDTTRTSSSPSGSIWTVTSSMTMPWTPNTCPNTLALRMPCPSPSSGPIARPKLRQGAACRPKAAGQAPTTTSQEPLPRAPSDLIAPMICSPHLSGVVVSCWPDWSNRVGDEAGRDMLLQAAVLA